MKPLLFVLTVSLCGGLAIAQQSRTPSTTYDAVVSGMTCKQNTSADMECDYRVGRSLHFGIAGVGQKDASIYFYSSSFEGDYFAVFGLSHGCVVVRQGRSLNPTGLGDSAFVSPQNGRAYRTWEECSSGR